MFKENSEQYKLVDWMVYQGHVPKNLSKTDLIQIMTFITYYNSGDFTAILPKKLVRKLINGLLPDNNDCSGFNPNKVTYSFNGKEYSKEYTGAPTTKDIYKFKCLVLNFIIKQPQYN